MSHFGVAVVLPKGVSKDHSEIEDKVAEQLAPYDEDGAWFADGSRWDWWVIGGRWDGAIRGLEWITYTEDCDLCDATGERPGGREQFGDTWYENTNGCNGCKGTGQKPVWTTDGRYQDLERNVTQVKHAKTEDFAAFITPEGEWVEMTRMGWWGMEIPDEAGQTKATKVARFDQEWARIREKYPHHLVVGVDCHV